VAKFLPGRSGFENIEKMEVEAIRNYLNKNSRCSALVKVANDFSDLFSGHSTWENFYAMVRIFKFYEIQLNNPIVKSKKMQLSSYPGALASIDDYY